MVKVAFGHDKILETLNFHRVCGKNFLKWIVKHLKKKVWDKAGEKTPFIGIRWFEPPPLYIFLNLGTLLDYCFNLFFIRFNE